MLHVSCFLPLVHEYQEKMEMKPPCWARGLLECFGGRVCVVSEGQPLGMALPECLDSDPRSATVCICSLLSSVSICKTVCLAAL